MKKVFKDLIPEYLRESLQILKGKKIYTDEFNKTKSIFIHIPKCAGTSIGEAIYGDKKIGHYTAEDFFYINKSKFNNYYKFTVIRDPLDRCYSAFHYLKSEKCTKNDKIFCDNYLLKYLNFDDFILNGLAKNNNILNYIHFKPQINFIILYGRLSVNHIFLLENLNDNFFYLQKKFLIDTKLKRLNKTTNTKKKNINIESKKKLYEIYREDFYLYSKVKNHENFFNFEGEKFRIF